jgi:hypothetical protein
LEHILLFDNCSIVILVFGGQDGSCIGGWLPSDVSNVVFDACICWMIYSKVFFLTKE